MTIDEKVYTEIPYGHFGWGHCSVVYAARLLSEGRQYDIEKLEETLDMTARMGQYPALVNIASYEPFPEQIRRLAEKRIDKAFKILVEDLAKPKVIDSYVIHGNYKFLIALAEDKKFPEDLRGLLREKATETARGIIEEALKYKSKEVDADIDYMRKLTVEALERRMERVHEAYTDNINAILRAKGYGRIYESDRHDAEHVRHLAHFEAGIDYDRRCFDKALQNVYVILRQGYHDLMQILGTEALPVEVRELAKIEREKIVDRMKTAIDIYDERLPKLDKYFEWFMKFSPDEEVAAIHEDFRMITQKPHERIPFPKQLCKKREWLAKRYGYDEYWGAEF